MEHDAITNEDNESTALRASINLDSSGDVEDVDHHSRDEAESDLYRTDPKDYTEDSVKKKKRVGRSIFREYLEVAMWGLPLFLFVINYVGQNFKIPTQSMENSLLIGDHLTVNKYIYGPESGFLSKLTPSRKPKRGDVVVFKFPGNITQFWVKRLIGLPGDRLAIINDHVFLNDQILNEEYAFYKTNFSFRGDRDPEIAYRPKNYYTLKPGLQNGLYRPGQSVSMEDAILKTKKMLRDYYLPSFPKVYRRLVNRLESGDGKTVPPGFFFVMGDNRNRSFDSREWGFVPEELMEGRAYWVWWSYGEDEGTHDLQGFDFAKVYLRYPFTFWTRTHWEESLRRIR